MNNPNNEEIEDLTDLRKEGYLYKDKLGKIKEGKY